MRRTLAFVCALGIAGPAFAQNQINGSPISQLPQATTPLTGTEVMPIVQSGTTKQITTHSVAAYIDGVITNPNIVYAPLASTFGAL